jgi:hypothetical protein
LSLWLKFFLLSAVNPFQPNSCIVSASFKSCTIPYVRKILKWFGLAEYKLVVSLPNP